MSKQFTNGLDGLFTITFSILLLSIPWDNNISSWAGVVFGLFALTMHPRRYFLVLENKIYLLLVIYFLYIVLRALFNRHEETRNDFIVDIIPFLIFPLIMASFSARVTGGRKTQLLITYAVGITLGFLGCFFLAMYTFWNEFYLFLNGYIPATTLIGMHPSYFSLFLAMGFAIVLDALLRNYPYWTLARKVLFVLWLMLLIFGILYIRSRTGVVSFFGVFAFLIFYSAPKKLRIILTIGLLVLVFLIYAIVEVTAFHKGRFQIDQVLAGFEQKQMQWQASWNIIREHPLFGVGPGNAQAALNKQYAVLGYQEGIEFRYNSHNQFLTSWIQGGIVGCFLLFLPMFIILRRGLREGRLLDIAFFLLTFLAFQTESMLHRHKGIFFYVIFLLLLGAKPVGSQESGLKGSEKNESQPFTDG